MPIYNWAYIVATNPRMLRARVRTRVCNLSHRSAPLSPLDSCRGATPRGVTRAILTIVVGYRCLRAIPYSPKNGYSPLTPSPLVVWCAPFGVAGDVLLPLDGAGQVENANSHHRTFVFDGAGVPK